MALSPSTMAKPADPEVIQKIEKLIDDKLCNSVEVKRALTTLEKHQVSALSKDHQRNYKFAVLTEQPNEHEVVELRELYKKQGWYDLRFFPEDAADPGRPPIGTIVLTERF